MWNDLLKDYRIILASSSPRRQQLLELIGIPFEVRIKPVDEIYPQHLKGHEISDFLAKLKASAFKGDIADHEILITSDTVVWHHGKSLAKPADEADAYEMLRTLSDDTHEVITSVCFTTRTDQKLVYETTEVRFKKLSDDEIQHYIKVYEPFDKAGGYGIQEWLGLIGIENIKGSYSNVVGLPTQLVYITLMEMVK